MKHSIAPLSINAFAPTIFPSCFWIKMGRQIELVLNSEINTGAIVKEEDGIGPSPPFKKTHDDQEEKYRAYLLWLELWQIHPILWRWVVHWQGDFLVHPRICQRWIIGYAVPDHVLESW